MRYVSVLDVKEAAILDVFCIFCDENDVVDSLIVATDSLVERLFILCERSLKWKRYNAYSYIINTFNVFPRAVFAAFLKCSQMSRIEMNVCFLVTRTRDTVYELNISIDQWSKIPLIHRKLQNETNVVSLECQLIVLQ